MRGSGVRNAALLACCLSLAAALTQRADVSDDASTRERRSLVFQSGAVLQLSFGVTSPVDIPNKSVTMAVALQANFALPTNATELELQPQRSARDAGLGAAYQGLEETHGRDCLLMSICQAAAAPLDTAGGGVLAELLHLVLTPSEHEDDPEDMRVGAHYLEAERRGRVVGDCEAVFSGCSQSPIDLFTRTFDP